MKIQLALAAAIVLGACATNPSIPGGDDTEAIAAATSEWVAAYDSRDPARIVALYDREAVLWGTTSATIRKTPEEIQDYFKDAGKRPAARVTLLESNIRVSGDMAVNAGTYTFTGVRDGKAITNPSRFSFVFRKRDGRWLILHHHSSRVPAP